MKQFEFEYTNYTDLDNELHKISLWCKSTAMSNMVFHIFTEHMNENKIDHIKTKILDTFPTAKYIGCSTNGNIYNGAFSNNDIIELFTTVFETCFNSMDEIVKEKCRIEDDLQLKQFRTEMVYMKKVLKMFELINVEPYREKIEGMSKFVNPKKLPKKKKKENKEITEDKDSISTSNTTNIESK